MCGWRGAAYLHLTDTLNVSKMETKNPPEHLTVQWQKGREEGGWGVCGAGEGGVDVQDQGDALEAANPCGVFPERAAQEGFKEHDNSPNKSQSQCAGADRCSC